MNRPLLIYIAATLTFITGLGHIAGTFMAVPVEQLSMHAAIATMKATMVPMPVGAARSYMQILDGNNLCTSLFLLFCAVQLITIAKLPSSSTSNRTIIITASGLAGFAIISAFYFFPVPTIFTGIAAVFCIVASSRTK